MLFGDLFIYMLEYVHVCFLFFYFLFISMVISIFVLVSTDDPSDNLLDTSLDCYRSFCLC